MAARRRALSGSSVARSSMPSAPDVLTTVYDTGCASRLASAARDWAVIAWMLRPMSGRSRSKLRPVGSPDHGVSSSLTARSLAAGEHRGERHAHVVKSGRQRQALVA